VIRRAERCDAGLAALAQGFAEDFAAPSHIQVFVTPADTHGFGWHFDAEHVFIAQTAGVKDYYFRRNTVSPEREARPDFTRFASERSPLATARLIAGDWLYLPARWWHMAKCAEASLSLSIGVHL
jgi:50S ribosomal protein L16 3-hydroxylase